MIAYLQKVPAIFNEEMEIPCIMTALIFGVNLYSLLHIFFVIVLVYKYDTGNIDKYIKIIYWGEPQRAPH